MNTIGDFYDLFDLRKQESIIEKINNFLEKNSIETIDQKNKNTLLLAAIADNNLEIVQFLISKEANVNGNRKAAFYPLERAVMTGDINIVKALDATGKLEYHRKEDQSLIYSVAFNDSIEICTFLLNKGIDINRKDSDDYTALHWAMQHQDIAMIQMLINHGANINVVNSDGHTPLYQAAGDNNMNEIKLLLNCGATVDLTKNYTPFMIACALGHYEIATKLIHYGANVDFKDNDGRTALFYCKIRQNNKMENFLLSIGASSDITDNFGISIQDLENDSIRKKLYDDLY